MRTQSGSWFLEDRRFPSLYAERRCVSGVAEVTSQMRHLLRTAVLEHELVHEGFVRPYFILVDALEKMAEALFKRSPNGVVHFELTRESGIKMLFKENQVSDGQIISVIDVGWIYAGHVNEVIETKIQASSSVLR
jgi:hypothetical protein